MQNTVTEDKLFNFRPVFFAGAFLALGIAFSYLTYTGVSAWWGLLFLLLGAPFFFCASNKKTKRVLLAVVLLACSAFVGFISFRIAVTSYTNVGSYDGTYTVYGRVIEISETDEEVTLTLDKVYIGSTAEKGRLNATLPVAFAGNFSLGTKVVLDGTVKSVVAQTAKYAVWNIGKNICFTAKAETCVAVGRTFDLALYIRQRIRNVVYAGMDKTSAAVTLGILTGDTAGIGEGLLQNIRYGGIAHIFAVSGLHIGALYTFCLALINRSPLKRFAKPLRFILLGVILLFYGSVCGFSPSVLRAVVMCLVFYATRLWGYGSDPLERIGIAGIAVLLLSPTALYEIGFQLSFAACLGIFLLVPPIESVCVGIVDKLFKRRKEDISRPPSIGRRIFKRCVSMLAVTLSAQIATAPLLLQSFGYLSGWSLLFNFLFVPLIGGMFSVLLIIVAVACVLPISVVPILLYAPAVVWSALLLVFEVVDLSAFAVRSVAVPTYLQYLYGLSITFLTDKWNVKRRTKIILFFVTVTAFAVAVYVLNI